MIDLTNAPEGATHYGVTGIGNIMWYFITGDAYRFYHGRDKGWSELTSMPTMNKVEKIGNWSIYNNTKPLSELSDEQRGLLFNHWCNGGGICSGFSECDIKTPRWTITETYRAKQKSERELFIDAFADLNLEAGARSEIIDALFDAGFKAPKVGE